jgi:hypothetical protein
LRVLKKKMVLKVHRENKELDKKATQAARGRAEERRGGMKKGVSSASKRADGIAIKGKTKGRMV